MDESPSNESGSKPKRRSPWQQKPGVNTLRVPTKDWFDPPLVHRPFKEILAEVNAAYAAIEERRFGRKKAK